MSSRAAEIFSFLRDCPQLADLWSIGATEEIGVRVVTPLGSSQPYQYVEGWDTIGGYTCEIRPAPSVYEDYQINCFQFYDPKDASDPEINVNVLSLDEVQAVCDWIMEQNELGNLPSITDRSVVGIECNPLVPQVRYVSQEDGIIAYFITLRVRYVSPYHGRAVEYQC